MLNKGTADISPLFVAVVKYASKNTHTQQLASLACSSSRWCHDEQTRGGRDLFSPLWLWAWTEYWRILGWKNNSYWL